MVKSLTSNWAAQTSIGGSINNSICIAKNSSGEKRMFVCNNDESIKIFSVPELQRVAFLQLPTAVNHCSVSPDGKKLAAVGDSNQIHLYDINNDSFAKLQTLTTSMDSGFSVCWNQSSDKFAVASQDGFISVWDVRSSEKLARIASQQNGQVKGACRTVKFTMSGSIDLLMFSEHVSYFNIVDARTFDTAQSIRVCPPTSESHISGMSVSPDSEKVFVGITPKIPLLRFRSRKFAFAV